MNVQEIEKEIQQLRPEQLQELATWFDEYRSVLWDEKIERDLGAGRLDSLVQNAQNAYSKRQYREL
ncbi:hypothetical protein [Runella sp.]|jgi:hypothetical protein|uniref:hypothetical protein n=1 Tax=Runella sp. TaxID=1960881 RepID=UPI002602F29F|nr:hypothetical protein [Runella sp.]